MRSSESEGDDPFAFIAMEASSIPPSQLAILQNSPFLNDDQTSAAADHRRSPAMTPPADDPILICSLPLPQTQTQLDPQSEPETQPASEVTAEKSPVKDSTQPLRKKSVARRRRSSGGLLVSYSESDDREIDYEAGVPAARMLPVTLREPEKESKRKDPGRKCGSCGENPTPALKTPIKQEKEGDSCEKMGPESEKTGSKNPSSSSAPSNENPPTVPTNLLDAIMLLSPPADPKLGEMDILDICAMRGIHFENPRWHRPGGYDRKPKDPQK